jgi:hypothetical protein
LSQAFKLKTTHGPGHQTNTKIKGRRLKVLQREKRTAEAEETDTPIANLQDFV